MRIVKIPALFLIACLLGISASAQVSDPTRPGSAQEEKKKRVFGPYEALSFNDAVLRDVKVEADGNIFLQLRPDHKDKELVVKISNSKFADYRAWWHGGLELVSPANAGKLPLGWTDRVQTKSRYIEYWMDGQVFLHLMLTDA